MYHVLFYFLGPKTHQIYMMLKSDLGMKNIENSNIGQFFFYTVFQIKFGRCLLSFLIHYNKSGERSLGYPSNDNNKYTPLQ